MCTNKMVYYIWSNNQGVHVFSVLHCTALRIHVQDMYVYVADNNELQT